MMSEERKIMVEEVETVEAPPKARVDSPPASSERQRDYLDGFLAAKPTPVAAGEPGGNLYDAVVDALKEIYDPEIPVNIYDLGLIYGLEAAENGNVEIKMTLTAPGCPVAGILPGWVADAVAAVDGVGEVEVTLVWSPPWSPDRMSDDAKLALDI